MENIFALLDHRIQNLLSKAGIQTPTEPQRKAIPAILAGDHVLLIAPTGLGKTEAALLPIFHRFLHIKKYNYRPGISILYITPLRALNRDMLRRTIEWGKKLGISVAVRHGDTPQKERLQQSKKPPDMLITTPETVQILFTGKNLRQYLKEVKFVIVDEIHELANDERGAQLTVALERLHELCASANKSFQRIGLSATVGSPDEVARFLAGFENNSFRHVTILQIDIEKQFEICVEYPKGKNNEHELLLAEKLSLDPEFFTVLKRCKELIDAHTSTLVFINTRDGAEILTARFRLWQKNYPVGVHHGSLSKAARIESENDFKKGVLKALVCTSSLELGIDVGDTDFVIQYNSPREVTRLIQRVGRSGHQIGRISKGVICTTNPDDLAESLVIAKRALTGQLEPIKVRQNPLSVLTNQIISITLEYGKIPSERVYTIITRAYPFYSLTKKMFDLILHQLQSERMIWVDTEENVAILKKKLASRRYFLENISMIPDEKNYPVVDISSRRTIGTLDESFVLTSAFEGEKMILHGLPWTVVKREDDQILVSPAQEIGIVPSWAGEDIPVPFEIAREVGMLRRKICTESNLSEYPTDSFSLDQLRNYIKNQQQQGFLVPDDQTITIEYEDRSVIINACFGTKVNETLGRLISALLAQAFGESIGITSDPYRIHLELPGKIPLERIRDILLTTNPDNLEYLLKTILRNSTYIRWELVKVARKFGALRKDFDYKNIGIKKLLDIFEQSLVFEEALDKLLWDRMDMPNTRQILSQIQQGLIAIHIVPRLSPIATSGFETIRGLMVPQRSDRSILMTLKKRLEDVDISLVCMNCFHRWHTTVRRIETQPKCSRCGAIKVAVLPRRHHELTKLISQKNRTKEEARELQRLYKNASLVVTYGRHAVFCLVGRGIGPDTAARILRRYQKRDLDTNEEQQINFLRDILKAELNYAKTRGFWDT
ncbi:MAG: DEAD/DEAH box helicase [Candidatus Thermoplasmatota archaeon]